jgi:hypothetical protein
MCVEVCVAAWLPDREGSPSAPRWWCNNTAARQVSMLTRVSARNRRLSELARWPSQPTLHLVRGLAQGRWDDLRATSAHRLLVSLTSGRAWPRLGPGARVRRSHHRLPTVGRVALTWTAPLGHRRAGEAQEGIALL